MDTMKVMRHGAMAVMAASTVALSSGCFAPAAEQPVNPQEIVQMNNADFYTDGKLDTKKCKAAYFEMMKKVGAPVYDVYLPDDGFLWTVDFGQGDFARFGMGGVFWVNDREHQYFGHEIFLLPGQSIAEHRHLPTTDDKGPLQAKHESWLVRHGSVYAFSEASKENKPNLDEFPEVVALLNDKQREVLKCTHVEKWEADGKLHRLYVPEEKGAVKETWHFMMGGPNGAVVTEFGCFHDNNGLRFTVPGASL